MSKAKKEEPKRDLSCPEADHYSKCPKFTKTCDGINCWSQYTWQEREAIGRARGKR